MKKLSVFAALLALFAGTAAGLHSDPRVTLPGSNSAMLNNKAAFRDGFTWAGLRRNKGGRCISPMAAGPRRLTAAYSRRVSSRVITKLKHPVPLSPECDQGQ